MGNWKNLGNNLINPIKISFGYPYFWLYFILLIIGISGFGIWVNFSSYFQDMYKGGDLNLALISFSIVLLYSSGIDMLSDENSKKNGFLIIGILELILPILSILFLFILSGLFLYIVCWSFYIISIIAWWHSNGNKEIYKCDIVDMDTIEQNFEDIRLTTRQQ